MQPECTYECFLTNRCLNCLVSTSSSGAGGELQTYQIRTASTSMPQTVVMSSHVGLPQGKPNDPTVKREIRLAKNRLVCGFISVLGSEAQQKCMNLMDVEQQVHKMNIRCEICTVKTALC